MQFWKGMTVELENKTIIITGASSGIGAAAATLFTIEGAQVVLGARRKVELEALVDQITRGNGQAICLAGDVTDEGYAQALVDMALDQFGSLDGAFNNAGVIGELSPVTAMDTSNWQAVMEANLTSAFYAAKAQIPVMESQGKGAIVFTS